LKKAIKYLPTGKELPHHITPLQMNLGHFLMRRRAAVVWPLERLADPLIGLTPDILLGPDLFKERFILSFDPYQKKIFITEFSF
jgi:hypothetical protein